MRLSAKFLLYGFLHSRHADHPADENDFIDLRGFQSGVRERAANGLQCFLDQVAGELLELGAGEREHQVLGPGGICGEVGQVDLGLLYRG